jgi:hypothetical protein
LAVIGFRCFPDGFSYVILDGTQDVPVVLVKNRCMFPQGRLWGQQLVWLRKQVVEILQANDMRSAGMKSSEPSAKQKNLFRSEVEGIVKEAFCSHTGRECVSRIKSQLCRDIKGFQEPARYLDRALIQRNLSELNNPTYLEATLAAIAELPSDLNA